MKTLTPKKNGTKATQIFLISLNPCNTRRGLVIQVSLDSHKGCTPNHCTPKIGTGERDDSDRTITTILGQGRGMTITTRLGQGRGMTINTSLGQRRAMTITTSLGQGRAMTITTRLGQGRGMTITTSLKQRRAITITTRTGERDDHYHKDRGER